METQDEGKMRHLDRRQFIKHIGAAIFGLTILSQVARAQACDYCEGEPDCDQPGESDGSCDWFGDHDGGCGNGEMDNACDEPDETDNNCQPPCSDAFDSDGSCNRSGENDGSCGDCDDNHDTDDNCAVQADVDNLCGHPHNYYGDEDNNCTANGTAQDTFCGTYNLSYQWGGAWKDTDQHCNGTTDTDNSNDNRTSCGSDTNAPEWHYSGTT